ncbi:MAG: M20/M25/M40 family metallo-hydrolase, partial [Bacteroidales bacterium]|nr:M20/M25/M40 family metallo-hydrolase [Bacteroidales bacterium]
MAEAFETYIDSNQERFIDELKEFMRFPSVSAQRDRDSDTQACAEWLRDRLQSLGLESELIDIGGRPIVRALGKGTSSQRIVVYGHYDVQPEDPLDEWQTPPFEPTVKDGVMYGRGATDDKGQLLAHVVAVESLLKTEGQLPCTVEFLIEGEEESHGDALPRYIQANKDALKAEAVIVSDSTMYDETTPALTIGLRGIVAFEFSLYGADKDVHSGAYGGGIANPVTVLTQML